MRKTLLRCGLLAMAALTMAGCGGILVDAPVGLSPGAVAPAADYTDLATVLAQAVSKNDELIPYFVNKHAAALETQLKRLAGAGPTATPNLFPTPEEKLAYWYNARTAWSIKLAAVCEFRDTLAREEYLARPFPVDGRTMTLDQIDAVLAGDSWQAVVAAPDVCLSRAPLPRAPFAATDIRAAIAQRVNDFAASEKRFVISVEDKTVLVPPVVWQFRDRFATQYQDAGGSRDANLLTMLLPQFSGLAHKRLQDAIGYKVAPAAPECKPAIEKIPDLHPL